MLDKDPQKRLDVIGIYDHPWVQKYRCRYDNWSDSQNSKEDELKQSEDSSTSWSQNSYDENDDEMPNLGADESFQSLPE